MSGAPVSTAGTSSWDTSFERVPELYSLWRDGSHGYAALIVEGEIVEPLIGLEEVRTLLLAREPARALVVLLWPLGGWRHPRLVVDHYRHVERTSVDYALPIDPLARDFAVTASLAALPQTEESGAYILVREEALLARYRRVSSVRQAIDAADPPLAPVVFGSSRLGHVGPYTIMPLQGLLKSL